MGARGRWEKGASWSHWGHRLTSEKKWWQVRSNPSGEINVKLLVPGLLIVVADKLEI